MILLLAKNTFPALSDEIPKSRNHTYMSDTMSYSSACFCASSHSLLYQCIQFTIHLLSKIIRTGNNVSI